jgi:mRNA-degrading endonuclease toxin of MazEF toxin-antitoxin module
MNRGEIWLAALGYNSKIRAVLVLSVQPGNQDRALVSYVIRTTSVRGSDYEVPHQARGMKTGAFDAQGLGTTDRSHFIRLLGRLDEATLAVVEDRVRAWLAL